MENTTHINSDAGAHPHAHARVTSPVLVFAVLVVSTIIEIGVTLLPGMPRSIAVPMLLALSFVKASLVALYFMHLRYEKVIYGMVFVAPAAFAVFLIAVLLSF